MPLNRCEAMLPMFSADCKPFCQPLCQSSRLLWAAPCSVLGLMLCGFALLAGGRMRCCDGALECCLRQGIVADWLERYQPFAAITFGHVIVALRSGDLRLWHAHERVHVRQFEVWGVFMLLAYPLSSVWAAWRGEEAYRGNWFERQAYAAVSVAQ